MGAREEARRARMPKTVEWHGYELDEPPEEDDEYMRDIELRALVRVDGRRRAEARDAYAVDERAEMKPRRRLSAVNAPPLEEDAAYLEDVGMPVRALCLDSEAVKGRPVVHKQERGAPTRRRVPRRRREPRPPSPFSNDAELPSIYWRDPYLRSRSRRA